MTGTPEEYSITLEGKLYKAKVSFLPSGRILAVVNDVPFELAASEVRDLVLEPPIPLGNVPRIGGRSKITSDNLSSSHAAPLRASPDMTASSGALRAVMPGRILAVNFKEGDLVKKGQPLVVLESMKMENVIASPYDGKLGLVAVSVGDSVQRGQTLIEFESPPND